MLFFSKKSHRSVIPSAALRAAASAVKHEDDRRLFHNAALRKRRKEMGDQMDPMRRLNRVSFFFSFFPFMKNFKFYQWEVGSCDLKIRGLALASRIIHAGNCIFLSNYICLNSSYILQPYPTMHFEKLV